MKARRKRTEPAEPLAPGRLAQLGERRWLHAAALALLAMLAFSGVLDAGFTWDDKAMVLGDAAVQGELSALELKPRLVRRLSLALDHALYGASPTGYHVTNLLLHVLCTLLVWRLAARIIGRDGLAFATALLFSLHPVHVEAVANLTNRKEMLCLAFSLGAFLSLDGARGLAGRARWARVALAAALFGLALFSKQVAIVLPATYALYEWLLVPREARLVMRRPLLALAAGATGALGFVAFVLWRWVDLDDPSAFHTVAGFAGEPSHAAFALTAAPAFFRALGLLLWPAGLCPDHLVTLHQGVDAAVVASWLGITALVAIAIAAWRRAPILSLGIGWVLIQQLPVSNLIPSAYVLADRYLYLPSVGFLLAAVWGADALLRRALAPARQRAVGLALLAALALALGTRSFVYVGAWQSDETVCAHALRCNPASVRARVRLGELAIAAGAPKRALPHLAEAAALRPDYAAAVLGHATALQAVGEHREALSVYQRALERWPDYAEVHYNRALSMQALGDLSGAITAYDRALEMNPELAAAYHNRGRLQARLGRLEQALDDYRSALARRPDHAGALLDLGLLEARTGDTANARRSLAQAAVLGQGDARRALVQLDQVMRSAGP